MMRSNASFIMVTLDALLPMNRHTQRHECKLCLFALHWSAIICSCVIKGSDSLPVEVGVPDPPVGTFPSVSAVFLFCPDLDGDGSLSEESKTAAEDEKSNLWLKTGCSPLDGALRAACD